MYCKNEALTVQFAGVATIGRRSTSCNESTTRSISLESQIKESTHLVRMLGKKFSMDKC